MPRIAKGELRYRDGQWIARITLRGSQRASFAMPTCKTEEHARCRSELLADVAKRLRAVNVEIENVRDVLQRAALAKSDAQLRAIETTVNLIVGGDLQFAGCARSDIQGDRRAMDVRCAGTKVS